MAYPLRKVSVSRRAVLRGAGAGVALPWLDAMLPALRGSAPKSVLRAVFVYMPNGAKMDDWRPTSATGKLDLPKTLKPLDPVRQHVVVFSGLTLDGARAHGDGPGDHARAAAAFLTCEHPQKTGGIRAGVSVDQVLARELGPESRYPSLELGMERGRLAGNCDSGYSCAYAQQIAWRSPTEPLAKEWNPDALFGRLFGESDLTERRAARLRARRTESVLDAVGDERRRLLRSVGKGADRDRLEEYFDAVRSVETRIARAERDSDKFRVPDDVQERLGSSGYADKLALMYDLIALALASDQTRFVTFMVANAGSNRSYRFLEVPEGHHYISHHGTKADKLAKYQRINQFHVSRFAGFVSRLAETKAEAGEPLIKTSFALMGSGLSDGNRHNHDDLPIVGAGRLNGAVRTGRHVRHKNGTPLANLYEALLGAFGVPSKSGFADSTEPLAGLR